MTCVTSLTTDRMPFDLASWCRSRLQILAVVVKDLVHDRLPLGFVVPFGSPDKVGDRPITRVLLDLSLEPNSALDDCQAMALLWQDHCVEEPAPIGRIAGKMRFGTRVFDPVARVTVRLQNRCSAN